MGVKYRYASGRSGFKNDPNSTIMLRVYFFKDKKIKKLESDFVSGNIQNTELVAKFRKEFERICRIIWDDLSVLFATEDPDGHKICKIAFYCEREISEETEDFVSVLIGCRYSQKAFNANEVKYWIAKCFHEQLNEYAFMFASNFNTEIAIGAFDTVHSTMPPFFDYNLEDTTTAILGSSFIKKKEIIAFSKKRTAVADFEGEDSSTRPKQEDSSQVGGSSSDLFTKEELAEAASEAAADKKESGETIINADVDGNAGEG
jgi:hypothetical protein